jgi:murein DD-endopeptidase MepM/ murein hydrolase activator NlpD
MIDHGENKVSYYAHNDVLKVQKGDKVFKGQLIALSGNTGRSTGPHLHFEVRINNSPVNPIKYVNY